MANTQVDPFMLVQDLGQYLQTNSVGILGTTLYMYTMPSTPVVVVSLFSDGGAKFAVDVVSRPHIQVIVRNTIVTSLMPLTTRIFRLLDKRFVTMARCQGRFTADHYPNVYRDENNFWISSTNYSTIGIVKVV